MCYVLFKHFPLTAPMEKAKEGTEHKYADGTWKYLNIFHYIYISIDFVSLGILGEVVASILEFGSFKLYKYLTSEKQTTKTVLKDFGTRDYL